MTPHTIPQTVLFPDLLDKPLVAGFDQPHTSSDGGAVLLRAAEQVYGLVDGFVCCLVDRREPGKVRHTLATCSASGSSASPVAIPTAMTPTDWPTTPSTSCCWNATWWPATR